MVTQIKETKMSAAVIIRFHYDENPSSRYYATPEQFAWRYNYFASMCLPRIRRQLGEEFDICIWCEPNHKELFEKLDCKTFGITDEYREWIRPNHKGKEETYHIDFVPWNAVVGLNKYDLQIAMDSDDLLLRDDTFNVITNTFRNCEGTGHITFQLSVFDVTRCQLYTSHFVYSLDNGAPFYALWQPSVSDEDFVFALGPDTPGEIAIRGATLMRGYYKVEPEQCFDELGFFRTRDGGQLDADGYLHWTGRLSDMIKTGGANVSPVEIEASLADCPDLPHFPTEKIITKSPPPG